MNRRAVLAGAGTLAVGPVGGCLGGSGDAGGDATGTEEDRSTAGEDDVEGTPVQFEARSTNDAFDVPIVEGGLAHHSNEDGYYATLVTDRDGLDRFDFEYMEDQPDIDDETVGLVRETAFDEAFLLVVQTILPSGSMSLELETVGRLSDREIAAAVRTPPIEGGDAEAVRATIFARVQWGDAPAPERARITYYNDPNNGGEATVFRTDG